MRLNSLFQKSKKHLIVFVSSVGHSYGLASYYPFFLEEKRVHYFVLNVEFGGYTISFFEKAKSIRFAMAEVHTDFHSEGLFQHLLKVPLLMKEGVTPSIWNCAEVNSIIFRRKRVHYFVLNVEFRDR